MQLKLFAVLGSILIALMLSACASAPTVAVPNTQPGDQLQSDYMHGQWCTNRGETSQRNQDANFSAMTNVTKQFWQFTSTGEWQVSSSGWMFQSNGSWKLEGRDSLLLAKHGAEPVPYRAQFVNNGNDLVLQSKEGDFLVMERCD
jgi:hypothetical protein